MTRAFALQPAPQSPQANRARLTNLAVRVITALTGLPIVAILILWGGVPFTVAMLFLALVGIAEYFAMEQRQRIGNNTLFGLLATSMIVLSAHWRFPNGVLWTYALLGIGVLALEWVRTRSWQAGIWRVARTVGGVTYIALPFACVITIRQIEPFGLHWAFAIIGSVWVTDTFAYLLGKMFGRRPLAPQLSPKKTIEGAIGGGVIGAIVPMVVLYRVDLLTVSSALFLCLCPLVAIAGDLFESVLKRHFGVKDSALPGFNLVPGHGGLLDRLDSNLWVMAAFYLFLRLNGTIDWFL